MENKPTPSAIHKKLLVDFWLHFDKDGKKQKLSYLDREETLELLIQMSEVVVPLGPRKISRKIGYKRRRFDKKKKRPKYQYQNCFVCWEKAQCRHHIILIKNGGENHHINLIGLCHSCHAEIHPWLKSSIGVEH